MGKEKVIFQGRVFSVVGGTKKLPNGYRARFEYIKHPGAVLIIPFLAKEKIVLIRQYRPVVKKYLLEFPAGTREPGESSQTCARRELIEETGYSANRLEKICSLFPVPGYSTEEIILYRAEELVRVAKQSMQDEVLVNTVCSLPMIQKLLAQRKIIDAKTLAALALIGISGR